MRVYGAAEFPGRTLFNRKSFRSSRWKTRLPPFVHLFVDCQRLYALRSLGYADGRVARIHFLSDPVAVDSLSASCRVKRSSPDQVRNTNGVVSITPQQREPHKVSERIIAKMTLVMEPSS